MKKIMLVAIAAAAIPLFAAQEKLLAVKIADNAEIVRAVGKFGEFTGNAMIGAMVSGAIQSAPHVAFFGPMRNGASAAFLIYGDTSASDLEKISNSAKRAVVYPMQDKKDAFLKRHPKSVVGKDGVIKVTKGALDMFGKNGCHVVFSKDGKWAAAADDAKTAKAALADEKFYSKSNEGDLARLYVMPAGIKLASMAIEKAAAEKPAEADGKLDAENAKVAVEFIKKIKAGYLAIAVNDKGIDLSGSVLPVEGSDLAAIGKKGTIDPVKALSAAQADSVSTSVYAPGLFNASTFAETIDMAIDALAKNGIKTEFMKYSRKGNNVACALDIKKAVEYISGEGKKALEKVDDKAFEESMEKVSQNISKTWYKYDQDTKSGMIAIAMPPYKPEKSPSAMFTGVFSKDEIRKDAVFAAVYSFYDIVKVVIGELMKVVKDPEFDQLKPLMAMLPPEGNGGCGAMSWVEKGKIRGLYRISPGEIKGISSFANIAMASMMSKAAAGAQMSFDDDDDDDDD